LSARRNASSSRRRRRRRRRPRIGVDAAHAREDDDSPRANAVATEDAPTTTRNIATHRVAA
jgi:hypothetical protein